MIKNKINEEDFTEPKEEKMLINKQNEEKHKFEAKPKAHKNNENKSKKVEEKNLEKEKEKLNEKNVLYFSKLNPVNSILLDTIFALKFKKVIFPIFIFVFNSFLLIFFFFLFNIISLIE